MRGYHNWRYVKIGKFSLHLINLHYLLMIKQVSVLMNKSQTSETESPILTSIKQEVRQKNQKVPENRFTVVKRNGTIVPFRKERISRAIEAAFRATKKIDKEKALPSALLHTIEMITDQVVAQAFAIATKGTSLTVEGIQDLVEVALMKNDHHEVARSYIIYRDHHKALRAGEPQNLKIYRKQGDNLVQFNPIKISVSVEKIFRKIEGIEGQTPQEMVEVVNTMTQKIVKEAVTLAKTIGALHIHHIENLIEEELMRDGYFQAAKEYILYRASKKKEEEGASPRKKERVHIEDERTFSYVTEEGHAKTISTLQLLQTIDYAVRNLEKEVSAETILEGAILHFYEGMKEKEIDHALILSAKANIEKEPTYAKVASRFLLNSIYRETIEAEGSDEDLDGIHRNYFKKYVKRGIEMKRLTTQLLDFDLDALGRRMDLSRDDSFDYFGLQTLYDRYLLQNDGKRLETPQIFWMRVAMGLALNEIEKTAKTIEFYNLLSTFSFLPAPPILLHAATTHPHLSSASLLAAQDDLTHIFHATSLSATRLKWVENVAHDWTYVRGKGAPIRGTSEKSGGIIPFLKVAEETAHAIHERDPHQGVSASLEVWHIDIEEFLNCKSSLHLTLWIPDLFMKRMKEKGNWTLFSPEEVKDLHDLCGKAFDARYIEYEKKAEEGTIKRCKTVEAILLWRKMLSTLFETGKPYLTFKDPTNISSSQDHTGVIHSASAETEILLPTSPKEPASCISGSINLAAHMTKNGVDEKRLETTIQTAIRMLDNSIDLDCDALSKAHRPLAFGMMGFQEALTHLGISYASHEAVQWADMSMEMISYYAIKASIGLAKERNPYPSYKGSKWERGLLPFDRLDLIEKERGETLDIDCSHTMNWDPIRQALHAHGIRNSTLLAIGPNTTLAHIANVTPSIEPRAPLNTCMPNPLTTILNGLGLWDEQMIENLKYFDGSLKEIGRIPEEIKKLYLNAFEIDPEWIIECASRRQKWIDMGQTLPLYLTKPNGKQLHTTYLLSWQKGLKGTHALHVLGGT
jgi:ribonucleoside-diphosphate reductase alpha chain